jgi:hypothetical protein
VLGVPALMARHRRLCSSITFGDFQEFESAAIGRGIELEIQCPHLMRMLSLLMPRKPLQASAVALSGDLAEPMTQLSLLDQDDLGRMPLDAATLIHHTADQPLNLRLGSKVSRRTARCASPRNKVFAHRRLQLGFYQNLFEPGVLLLQLS